jgi:hypothetical protein
MFTFGPPDAALAAMDRIKLLLSDQPSAGLDWRPSGQA